MHVVLHGFGCMILSLRPNSVVVMVANLYKLMLAYVPHSCWIITVIWKFIQLPTLWDVSFLILLSIYQALVIFLGCCLHLSVLPVEKWLCLCVLTVFQKCYIQWVVLYGQGCLCLRASCLLDPLVIHPHYGILVLLGFSTGISP